MLFHKVKEKVGKHVLHCEAPSFFKQTCVVELYQTAAVSDPTPAQAGHHDRKS